MSYLVWVTVFEMLVHGPLPCASALVILEEVCGERMYSLPERQEIESDGEKCDQADPITYFLQKKKKPDS